MRIIARLAASALAAVPDREFIPGRFRLPLLGVVAGLGLGVVIAIVSPRTNRAEAVVSPDAASAPQGQLSQVLSPPVLARAAADSEWGTKRPDAAALAQELAVRRKGADALVITASAPEPNDAIRLANAVARASVAISVEARTAADLAKAEQQARDIEALHQRVQAAESRLAAARRLAGDDQDISGIREAAVEARTRIEEAQKMLGPARDWPERLATPSLEKVRAPLAEALRMAAVKGPAQAQAVQQVRQLRQALLEEARRSIEDGKAELEAAQAVEEVTAARRAAEPPLSPADGPTDVPTLSAQVDALKAQSEAAERALAEPPARPSKAGLIAPATAAESRSALGFLRSLGLGASLGLCFGAMAGAALDLRRRRPSLSPTLAAQPRMAAAEPIASVAEPSPAAPAAVPDRMTVLVTSVEVEAARTELAIDLARRGVQDGCRVLLIDAQPRRRRLTTSAAELMDDRPASAPHQVRLGAHWRPVLPLFAHGDGEAFLVPAGLTPSPGDPRLDDLSGFDLVVIDGPEAGQDAVPLARQADRIVLADRDGNIASDPDGRIEAMLRHTGMVAGAPRAA